MIYIGEPAMSKQLVEDMKDECQFAEGVMNRIRSRLKENDAADLDRAISRLSWILDKAPK